MSDSDNIGRLILYTSPAGDVEVDVRFEDESIWMTQKMMADLFGVQRPAITKHLTNIINEGELNEQTICSILEHIGENGRTYKTTYYNLDAIISVGYRVNSLKATQFRIWATEKLREFIIKGFVIDENRLKNGRHFGKDYFDDLLEKIRDIRASERRFYQKITDIYALSADYDPKLDITKKFFAHVQNKFLYGITGKTSTEIIKDRANSKIPNMGLYTWKNSPGGKILKSDVSVSKNYLSPEELRKLNRIVTMFLDFAELQAENNVIMNMSDWVTKLDSFLEFNTIDVLKNFGIVQKKVAKALAEGEYEKFKILQDRNYISDFDKSTAKYLKKLKE